jgi:hypothetical protein
MFVRVRRLIFILLGACVLGVVMSVLKGSGGGARLEIGNISAPWLAIAFVAGAFYTRPGRASAAGLCATMAALVGFYGQQSPLADLDGDSLRFLTNPSTMYHCILAPHAVIFLGGALTGLALGALGSIWADRRSRHAAAAIALCFVLEPFAWIAFSVATSHQAAVHSWWLGIGEIAIGVTGMLAVVRRSRIE